MEVIIKISKIKHNNIVRCNHHSLIANKKVFIWGTDDIIESNNPYNISLQQMKDLLGALNIQYKIIES